LRHRARWLGGKHPGDGRADREHRAQGQQQDAPGKHVKILARHPRARPRVPVMRALEEFSLMALIVPREMLGMLR
jgi:hypothetical protein